jgi:hypothetical protein
MHKQNYNYPVVEERKVSIKKLNPVMKLKS